jgi:hypothetical protein
VVPLRGSVKILDRNFTIRDRPPRETSYARFSPANGILPELVVVADTQVQDRAEANQQVRVNLTLEGRFVRENNRIKINLEPRFAVKTLSGETAQKQNRAYSDGEIVALVLLSRSDLSALSTDLVQTGGQALLQNLVVGPLERELARAFALDQVKVDIPILAGGRAEDTRFTIGKYLLPELFFSYAFDFTGTQTIAAEYLRGDYRIGLTTSLSPRLNQGPALDYAFALGYTIRPLGADLTTNLAFDQGDLGTDIQFGLGLNFRY